MGTSVLGGCQRPVPCSPPGWLSSHLVCGLAQRKGEGSGEQTAPRQAGARRLHAQGLAVPADRAPRAGYHTEGRGRATGSGGSFPGSALAPFPDELLGTSKEAQDVDMVSVPLPNEDSKAGDRPGGRETDLRGLRPEGAARACGGCSSGVGTASRPLRGEAAIQALLVVGRLGICESAARMYL